MLRLEHLENIKEEVTSLESLNISVYFFLRFCCGQWGWHQVLDGWGRTGPGFSYLGP